ncbi:heat shock 70 kDa protein 12A-like [Mytilus edulis]|uniref:heat shock 70 kDa protein 12A-like n=1 Tax=Mytilus edulis TaxID=6550 RepID=UPI0039EE772A
MDYSMLVTAIKIGTKSCGFAHQFKYQFEDDPKIVQSYVFMTEKAPRLDFPSAFILSKEGHAEEFGYQAIQQFEENEDYSKDFVFFENVIESLYISEDLDDETLIKDSRGGKHKALDIFGKFMKKLVDFSYLKLTSRLTPEFLKRSDIKWVLMIPSVRTESGVVAFFEKAWHEVFWNDTSTRQNLSIVAFPDAALTYYSYLTPNLCNGISINKILPGERVMIIGFEDEIDSLNIYEKIEDCNFKQVVHFLSGASSKCLILKAFDSFFENLIGSWIWTVAKRNLWQDIVSKVDSLLKSKMDTKHMETFVLSYHKLEKICDQHTNTTLKQIIETSEYSSKIKYMFELSQMRVQSSLLKSIFEKCLSNIVRNIKHVLAKSDDKEVNTLILAGNIAGSGLLIQTVQTAFPSKQIAVSDTHAAMEAALRGAVLYGHTPIVVSSIFSGAQVMVAQ